MTWDRWLYFPSEGRRAEDFFVLKIRWLWPGVNPRTGVPKASALPLDHRSRWPSWLQLALALSAYQERRDSLFTGWRWDKTLKCTLKRFASCAKCDSSCHLPSSEYGDVQVQESEGESGVQFVNSTSQRPIPWEIPFSCHLWQWRSPVSQLQHLFSVHVPQCTCNIQMHANYFMQGSANVTVTTIT